MEGNRLSAQLALEEDLNEAHLLHMIEETKRHPLICQKWLTALANHRVKRQLTFRQLLLTQPAGGEFTLTSEGSSFQRSSTTRP